MNTYKFSFSICPDDLPTHKDKFMVVITMPDGSRRIPARDLTKQKALDRIESIRASFSYGMNAMYELLEKQMWNTKFTCEI